MDARDDIPCATQWAEVVATPPTKPEEAISKNRQQFIRLIDERMRLALKALDRVGNLSNKTNYYYKDHEALKIIDTLNEKAKEVTKKFEAGIKSRPEKEWSLFD